MTKFSVRNRSLRSIFRVLPSSSARCGSFGLWLRLSGSSPAIPSSVLPRRSQRLLISCYNAPASPRPGADLSGTRHARRAELHHLGTRMHLPNHPQSLDNSAVEIDEFGFRQLTQITIHRSFLSSPSGELLFRQFCAVEGSCGMFTPPFNRP